MDCSSLLEIKNYIVTNIAGISAFIVSVLSLWVSWKAYRKDDPKLELNLYSAEIWGGTGTPEQKGLAVSVGNIGKVPVKLDSIGGNCKYYDFKILCSKVFRSLTPKSLEPHAFLVDAVEVNQYLRPQGVFITIPAGDRISFVIPDPRGVELGKYLEKNASSVYIFDAIGNKYLLSKARFSKLRRDYKNK